ncbi:MAG: hypothetical protein IJ523_01805 [Succinivibrionaceae bacterium]|nr:hypothetical protein [Succinivibrionaceae bacterium]
MTDIINRAFRELDFGLNPLDEETGVSSNSVNGFSTEFVLDRDRNVLAARSRIVTVNDFYKRHAGQFMRGVLMLNRDGMLPSGFRVGLDMVDFTVDLIFETDLSAVSEENLPVALGNMIRNLIYFSGQVRQKLSEDYDRLDG